MAYPLSWPAGQPRTDKWARRRNTKWRNLTVASACDLIDDEVRRLRGHDLVVSTNLALRIDGWPRSGQPQPQDPGAAVYFVRTVRSKPQQLVFACDKYPRVEENLRAISMHLDALRGMERWGVGTLDQAFAGYQALPSSAPLLWWQILGAHRPITTREELVKAYREAAKITHPDAGGSEADFVAARKAYEEGLQAIEGAA